MPRRINNLTDIIIGRRKLQVSSEYRSTTLNVCLGEVTRSSIVYRRVEAIIEIAKSSKRLSEI